jgi:bacterioferritin (cytochrome b1)
MQIFLRAPITPRAGVTTDHGPLVRNPLNNNSKGDDQELIKYLRVTRDVCDQHHDVATASLIENWIDETENRAWFLYEILHRA